MDDLSSHIAHTTEVYDALPYDDHPILRTHPSRLRATAALFGLDAVPLAGARVLELGCGAGGNIIPLAAFHSGATFLGIDLGGRMIADGKARIAAAGLTNIELRQQSITDLPSDIGEFDYILCHGVYSWVPETVREAILAICGRHLSASGIAYVSYNVLPGWRMNQPLRDALRLMVPSHLPTSQRVQLAAQLFRYMADMTPANDAYAVALRGGKGLVEAHSPAYIYHEYMEEVNEPFAFSDFVADAGRHGLGYLAEAELSAMFAERFEGDFAEKLSKTTRGDIISYEQMLDILSGNPFRTTLLVRDKLLPVIDRTLSATRMEPLHFIGSYLFTVTHENGTVSVADRGGRTKRYDDPVVAGLFHKLFGSGMLRSRTMDELLSGLAEEDVPALFEALLGMIISGVAIIMSDPVNVAVAGERPRANSLARSDAALGRTHTATRMHVAIELDDVPRFLARHCDGTRDRAALTDLLLAAFRAGDLAIEVREGQVPSADELPQFVAALVDRSIGHLAQAGLLDG